MSKKLNNTVCVSNVDFYTGDHMTGKKLSGASVFMDGELTLALNRLREEIRQKNEANGMPAMVPSIGWLARELLRDKLGLKDSKASKQDNFTQV